MTDDMTVPSSIFEPADGGETADPRGLLMLNLYTWLEKADPESAAVVLVA